MHLTEIVSVSPEEFKEFCRDAALRVDDKTSRNMLNESKITVALYGAPCIGLLVDGNLLSINVTAFQKSARKNAWGRYINFYLAYTMPEYRYKGFASMLVEHIEQKALELGYNRMRSLAGSYAGVRLHMHFGHQFWGIAKKGELIVDTPLRNGDEWPDGVPERARTAGENVHRMRLDEIALELKLSKRFSNEASAFGMALPAEAIANYYRKERQ